MTTLELLGQLLSLSGALVGTGLLFTTARRELRERLAAERRVRVLEARTRVLENWLHRAAESLESANDLLEEECGDLAEFEPEEFEEIRRQVRVLRELAAGGNP